MEPEEFKDDQESRDERKKEINDRIQRFLKNIPYDEVEEESVRVPRKKLINILIDEGIETVLNKMPKLLFTSTYYKSIDELYKHYLKNKGKSLSDTDLENILHIINLYEDEEEYEKCHVLVNEFSLMK